MGQFCERREPVFIVVLSGHAPVHEPAQLIRRVRLAGVDRLAATEGTFSADRMVGNSGNDVENDTDLRNSTAADERDNDGVTRLAFDEWQGSVNGIDAPEVISGMTAGVILSFLREDAEVVFLRGGLEGVEDDLFAGEVDPGQDLGGFGVASLLAHDFDLALRFQPDVTGRGFCGIEGGERKVGEVSVVQFHETGGGR